MASLRSQGMSRILRSAAAPRLGAPFVSQRFESSVAKRAQANEAPKRAQQDEVAPRPNQPDYDLPADKATS